MFNYYFEGRGLIVTLKISEIQSASLPRGTVRSRRPPFHFELRDCRLPLLLPFSNHKNPSCKNIFSTCNSIQFRIYSLFSRTMLLYNDGLLKYFFLKLIFPEKNKTETYEKWTHCYSKIRVWVNWSKNSDLENEIKNFSGGIVKKMYILKGWGFNL